MNSTVAELYPAFLMEDMANSGLEPADMKARLAGANEKSATNTPQGVDAYVIPYFDMDGRPIAFYRLKHINNPDPTIKYKQLQTSGNHVYFPIGFKARLRNAKYIIITEGEKKAAKAVKCGFACVGLGGVDSWRNRTVRFHKDTQLGQTNKGEVIAKLPPGADLKEEADTLATGMRELVTYAMHHKLPIIIAFDSDLDVKGFVRFEVQRAAAALGFMLRYRGIKFNNIRQVILKPEDAQLPDGTTKLGLDDFLLHEDLGPDVLAQQIHDALQKRTAFPKHPNTREYVNRKLQRANIPREALNELATAIICDLDTNGIRLHCPDDDNMYYFDETTHKLLRVGFSQHMEFAKTSFGKKLYDSYGLTGGDLRLLNVLNSQFCAEEPVQSVKPEKIMTIRGDSFYFQISDGQMVKVDAKGIRVMLNGSDNVLFEGGSVQPLDAEELRNAIKRYSAMEVLPNVWYDTLKEARIQESPEDKTRRMLSLLYSISPYFYRWRQTQLPLEQMLGEAGSGKSTLFVLRQSIISGTSSLRNAPKDLRDWTASVASAGALHVTDNVHMTNGMLKQQLSDELCRVITESEPHIEARKLYTDNELIRVPVKTVFAVTAIKQPFTNTDIIQRSIITELDKGTLHVEYDANWSDKHLNKLGGRSHWVAHQLVFMHRMFKLISTEWDNTYKAKFRLINVEQLLLFAAKVYNEPADWLPRYLEGTRDALTARADNALEGLCVWADMIRDSMTSKERARRYFTTQDMSQWFESEDEWDKNTILINPRRLAAYIKEKKNTIAQIAGVASTGFKHANREVYQVHDVDDPEF